MATLTNRREGDREATVVGAEYITNDMKLCITLDARGNVPRRIFKQGNIQYYAFDDESAAMDRDAYLRGEELHVSVSDFWRAYDRFRWNLQLRG